MHARLHALPTIRDAPAVTAAQMAEADRATTLDLGIVVEMLMENASYQIARACRLLLGDVEGRRIVGVCGTGNNGGDAIGAARRLRAWGADARCVLSARAGDLRDTARVQLEIGRRIGLPVSGPEGARLEGADLVVDGLLGYSVQGAPRGPAERLIRDANASGIPILAVDLPSGLDPDRGGARGTAVRAACTLTLAMPKAGLLADASRELVGELLLADIGIPPSVYERFGIDARPLFAVGDLVRIAG